MNISAEQRQLKLITEHCTEAGEANAGFYNLGWAQGEDFIHSKTSEGRLYSAIDIEGNVTHEWQHPIQCVLCKVEFWGFGNNPAPITTKGKACDTCNMTKVIPARMAEYKEI